MKAYLDTSALIRAWRLSVVPEGVTRAHSVAEFFCVLTGPGLLTVVNGKTVKVPVPPADAREAVLETFARVKFHDATGREALTSLESAVKLNLSGRLVHDWMHAEAAKLAGCDTLVTLNTKDFVRMAGKLKVVAPADHFARKS